MVSNRLPVTIKQRAKGVVIKRSIGGLVTALDSVVRRGHSKWVGWTGLEGILSASKLKHAGLPEYLVPVQAGRRLLKGYYNNFSNRQLWPSMHDIRPCCGATERDWAAYQTVNRRFAEAVRRVSKPEDMIWIQDYHLLMMPEHLRAIGQTNRIGVFLHIPFPTPEYWFALPHAQEMLESLCQANLLGLQTQRDVENFKECVKMVGLKPAGTVGVFPIGVDYGTYHSGASRPGARRILKRIQKATSGKKVVFSLSRLDYTKGIIAQLLAAERFLAGHPDRENFVYKLIVAPSREQVDEYQHLRQTIIRVVKDINRRLGHKEWRPVSYSYRNIGFEEVSAWYALADTLLLLPETDGMNLIAKEYVAARQNDNGMLILSETAGSSFQLRDALLVPPHDIPAAVRALKKAVNMKAAERKLRWAKLRANVKNEDVMWWADGFIAALGSK